MAKISIASIEELSYSIQSVDWKACFICQQDGTYDDLRDPTAWKGMICKFI